MGKTVDLDADSWIITEYGNLRILKGESKVAEFNRGCWEYVQKVEPSWGTHAETTVLPKLKLA